MNEIEVICPLKASDISAGAPDGVSIEDRGEVLAKAVGSEMLFVTGVAWAASIPAGVIASFLYDAIKNYSGNAPKNIAINDKPVEFRHDLLVRHILNVTGGAKRQ